MKYSNVIGTRKRRAVSPIIATLMLVAIAVVGGVMIFVYSQGFFGKTSSTNVSQDIITSTGYDFRMQPNIASADGSSIAVSNTAGNAPATGNCGTLFIKNSGTSSTTIGQVFLNGISLNSATGFPAVGGSAAQGTAGTYQLGGVNTGASTPTAQSSLNPGQEYTVFACFNANAVGNAAAVAGPLIGQSINVRIVTQGSQFTFPVVVGQRG